MLSESAAAQCPDTVSPTTNVCGNANDARLPSTGNSSGKVSGAQPNGTVIGHFPPPKTDKPRPHVCNTCGRSFARLEHLRRHERSHTKEKPFECPECTRCFARRDLLLRHQQKLHMTTTASARPRNGRRESVSGPAGAGRIRKYSIASNGVGASGGIGATAARPRANTLSHIDLSSQGLMDGHTGTIGRLNGLGITHGHTLSLGGLPGPQGFEYRGMSTSFGHHGNLHGLPKLETHALNVDLGGSLRTAPPYAGFGGFDLDQLFSPGNTINPAQLHFGGAQPSSATHYPPFHYGDPQLAIDEGDDFGWMRGWGMNMNANNAGNENAIEESSPSRMSSGDSPGENSEMANSGGLNIPQQNMAQWSAQDMQTQMMLQSTPFQMEALSSDLPNVKAPVGTISPQSLHDPNSTADAYFHQAMMQQNRHPESLQSIHTSYYPTPMSNFNSDSPSMSSSSMTGSARQSSVISASTDSITDTTRQAMLMSLSQPSVFGHNHRKYSQPTISSPLSPGGLRGSVQCPSLPSTQDIRRYVDAFLRYAHPHIPALHIPTLSFDTLEYSNYQRGWQSQGSFGQGGIAGGGGCLILAMAAIGALYEYDHPTSKELFEAAKKMMMLNLEERRRADMSAAVNSSNAGSDSSASHTPLWLVQAMLLNVIYGHQCGDKTAADIASTHCAALVSLARAANLTQPPGYGSQDYDGNDFQSTPEQQQASEDVQMGDAASERGVVVEMPQPVDANAAWLKWKTVEERKRTLFAVFILSSTLVTAYNQTPAIMNSEIVLDLPCEEELWSAETAQEWVARGGLAAADASAISFAAALTTLLTANQRQNTGYSNGSHNTVYSNGSHNTVYSNGSHNNPLGTLQPNDLDCDNDLRPSTFGCLVLINALHNYIWETRSRHHGRQWTAQETESMFSHIEPALNAWQAAWKANDHHKLERPNPFGLGPLSADSIPLLDLAFVRLFVNLGRSKEAFWQRDFKGMAEELAHGAEIVQHAEGSPTGSESAGSADTSNSASSSPVTGAAHGRSSHSASQATSGKSSKRERHLRKAAFYAADSLTIACSYNLTYADSTAHELPIQSAMCFFDCGQVLAEWASTVQERVGFYLGILGEDEINYTQVPAIMLLEVEDVELLNKIERICESMEAKRFQQETSLAMELRNLDPAASLNSVKNTVNLNNCGYGSKILRITAMMLEKAVVWPVTHVMAKALETQAAHMNQRAEASIAAP